MFCVLKFKLVQKFDENNKKIDESIKFRGTDEENSYFTFNNLLKLYARISNSIKYLCLIIN